MAKKTLRQIVEENTERVLNEYVNANVDEETIIEIETESVDNEQLKLVTEMARVNLKDGGDSEFPANGYRLWVQGDNSPHKPPHMHVMSVQDGWTIRVLLDDGRLWSVESYGNRGRKDDFSDVIKKVQSWFQKPTTMPGRVGTNQDAAKHEWVACNS